MLCVNLHTCQKESLTSVFLNYELASGKDKIVPSHHNELRHETDNQLIKPKGGGAARFTLVKHS